MKTKKHGFMDHVILVYFLFAILTMIVESIVSSFIDMPLAYVIPGYGTEMEMAGMKVMTASGVGTAVGALLMVGLFALIFRKEFDGMLGGKNLITGLLLLLPFLVFHWSGSVVSLIECGTGSVLIAFLRAFAPGFGEEIAFRGIGVANYMRKNNTDKGVLTIFWLSSLFFGFFHILNFFSGAPLYTAVIQSLYAAGVGMTLGAVYLRTGTLWPTIIGHLLVDFLEFIRADLSSSGGIMMGMTIGDWITIVAGVFAAGWALYLMRRSKRQEIIKLWDEKWKKEELPAQEPEAATAE